MLFESRGGWARLKKSVGFDCGKLAILSWRRRKALRQLRLSRWESLGSETSQEGLRVIHPHFGPGAVVALFKFVYTGDHTTGVEFESDAGYKARSPQYAKLRREHKDGSALEMKVKPNNAFERTARDRGSRVPPDLGIVAGRSNRSLGGICLLPGAHS
jgi:hypothetical protein